jgi:N6-L-threonylcarbamoyladenine synthase
MQQPTYAYANSSSSRSILKKGSRSLTPARRQLSFDEKPVVYCVSPIAEEGYYGGYTKMSREERRWTVRR